MQQKSLFFIVILLFSSCGMVTKTRYNNGLKWNLEIFQKAEKEKVFKENHAKRTEKKSYQKPILKSILDTNKNHIKKELIIFKNISKFKKYSNNFEEKTMYKTRFKKADLNKFNHKKGEYAPGAIKSFIIFYLSIIALIGVIYWFSLLTLTFSTFFLIFGLIFVGLGLILLIIYSYTRALFSRKDILESNGNLKGIVLVSFVVFTPFIALIALFLVLIANE